MDVSVVVDALTDASTAIAAVAAAVIGVCVLIKAYRFVRDAI